MNILIDTGILDVPLRVENVLEQVDEQYLLAEPKIYPSDGDTIVAVGPKQLAIVSAYWDEEGDPTQQAVDVFKVLMTTGVPERGNASCCPEVTYTPAKVARKVKLCGWELEDCRSVMVIKTPGKYQFIPNNAAEGVILTAQILPLQEFNHGLDNSIRP